MKKKSPFKVTRFEHEGQNLYFLSEQILADLEDSKPNYVVGGRGTGKTTLLQALSWEERLTNPNLQTALGFSSLRSYDVELKGADSSGDSPKQGRLISIATRPGGERVIRIFDAPGAEPSRYQLNELPGARFHINALESEISANLRVDKLTDGARDRILDRLSLALGNDPLQGKSIGVYFKLPEYQFKGMRKWLKNTEETIAAMIISTYLDLIWIELLCNATIELSVRKHLPVSPEDETKFVKETCKDNPKILQEYFDRFPELTLLALRRGIASRREEIVDAMRWSTNPIEIASKLGCEQVGAIGRRFGERFARLYSPDAPKNWHFKVCMDEGECLNEFEQKILNTMVRLSRWPVIPIVAFANIPENPSETLERGLHLSKADRHLNLLDELTDSEFREFATGVATVRVNAACEKKVEFDLEQLLGPLNVNALLEIIANKSVNPEAKDLIASAEKNSSKPFFREAKNSEEKSHLPIYQSYLVDRLNLKIPPNTKTNWEKRRQQSAEIRKRMVSAYLSICKELKSEVMYAGAEMVLQMSDGCMRDFLDQIDEIFIESGATLKQFVNSRISELKQHKALVRASKQKRDSIPRSKVRSASETARLIDSLGFATASIQQRSKNNEHLRSNERGEFFVRLSDSPGEDTRKMLDLVSDAAAAGFLKLIQSDEHIWKFRVHTSLAAYYEFSYRGTEYTTRLPVDDLCAIVRETDKERSRLLIEKLSTKLSGESVEDMPLFEWVKSEKGLDAI